jgi:RNA polymerase sigma-B factor
VSGSSQRWTEEQSDEVDRLLLELSEEEPDSPDHRAIRDRIVELHLPLLHYLAKRFAGRTENLEDLVQVGAIGLLKAIERFDPALGYRFATYAAPTITGEMKRHLRDTGWLVRVPRRAQELHASVVRVREELSQARGSEPSVSEIARELDVTPEEVAETLDVARARTGAPLDQLVDAADGPGLQSLVAEVDEGFEAIERRTVLATALAALTPQEQQVVRLRFASGRTQAQIAATIGVSQMQVSRILTRSVAKMRGAVDIPDLDV